MTAHADPPTGRLLTHVTAALWVLTMLAGGWSAERLLPAFADWPRLGEVRLWLQGLLLLLLAVVPSGPAAPLPRAARTWLLGVTALFAWLAASLAWSPNPAITTGALEGIAWLVLQLWCTAAFLRPDPAGRARAGAAWLVGAAACYIAAGLLKGPTADGRLAVFGGGPNVYARVAGFGALAGALLWASGSRRAALPLLAGGLLAVILSGSRGVLLSLMLTLAVTIWTTRRTFRWHGARLAAAGAIAVLVVGLARWQLVLDVISVRIVQTTFVRGDAANRQIAFAEALDMWRDAPLLGHGLGSFAHQASMEYPHNLLLQLGSEGGLLAVLLAASLAVLWWRATRAAGDGLAVFWRGATVLVAIASQFSGDFYDTRLLWTGGLVTLLALPSSLARREAAA